MRQHANPKSNPKHATPPAGNGEPFPPSLPVLEDHPFRSILKRWSVRERECDTAKQRPVLLTQAEIRALAQHHLDAINHFLGFMKTGGAVESSDFDRDDYHRARYRALTALLSEEDRERFREVAHIRDMHVAGLRDTEEAA